MTSTTRTAWARGRGMALFPREPGAPLTEGIAQALRDGVERGLTATAGVRGNAPALSIDTRAFSIEVRGREVGLLALRLDWPEPRTATIVAVAVDPAWRGRSYAARALFTAERALAAQVDRWYATVPRTNGRGFYFMLRCGYAPLLESPRAVAACRVEDVTWFERAPAARA